MPGLINIGGAAMLRLSRIAACRVACLWLFASGCSSLSPRPGRETPLPEGVDPGDLYNTTDGPAPAVVDARPYYINPADESPAAKAFAAAPKAPDLRREQQMSLDKNIPRGELALRKARADERRAAGATAASEADRRKNVSREGAVNLGEIGRAVAKTANPSLYSLVEPHMPALLRPEPVATAVRPKLGERYDFLVLSGGGSFGAYPAGIICGWHDCGTMPQFQVVTGVSTGALIATAAFPGGRFLNDLRRIYTSISQSTFRSGDLWRIKRFPHPFGIGSDSVASNRPLREILTEMFNQPGYFETVAAEHARGRRLYVGTTNLDTQRFVIWDLGAIATLGTPESKRLYVDVVVAAAAIPPLLTPSRITMTIDGRAFEELHVDGGAARSLFFYPPSDWPGDEEDAKTGTALLAGARVHVIVAGKVYEDPEGTEPKLVKVITRSVGTMLSSLTRAELARLYSHCQDRDMVFRLAAVPAGYPLDFTAAEFDPAKMTALFDEGYRSTQQDRVWNVSPPERAVSEERVRRSTVMTAKPSQEVGPFDPRVARPAGVRRP